MTAAVRQLRRTELAAVPTPSDASSDPCECGRGDVIGRVSYTQDRMWFFPLGSRNGDRAEDAADLRCIDCIADTAAELADGTLLERMRASGADVRAEREALHRRSQISVADQPRQTSPIKGDQR